MNPDIEKIQQGLTAMGYNPGSIDGINGPKTRAAAALFAKGEPPAPSAPSVPDHIPLPDFDPKGLLNGVKSGLAELVLEAAKSSSVKFVVIEGLRTKERQAQLVKSGASKTMNSRHLVGEAVDLWPLDSDGNKLPSDAAFPKGSAQARAADKALWDGLRKISTAMKAAAKDKNIKIEWGGDWKSFPDGPHFQLS